MKEKRVGSGRAAPVGALAALIALFVALMAAPSNAAASNAPTLDDALGLTRQQFVDSVSARWASVYEGTPYEGWYLSVQLYPSYNDGMWWPRGNPSPTGHVGMNCGGFVARTLIDAGVNDSNNTYMADWWAGSPNAIDGRGAAAGHYANARTFWRLAKTYGLEMYEFSNKWDLLNSGRAVKGDIIVMIDDADQGGVDDYGRYHAHANDSHIGIFWGDAPNDDKFLHSSHDVALTAQTEISGCVLSTIQPKCWGSRFYLIKFKDYGGINLAKSSAIPSISENNANYNLEGAAYGIFQSRAAAQAHDASQALKVMTTDAKGSWSTGRTLEPGTYYVAETDAPDGFALDGSVYEVEVTAGADAVVNGGSVADAPQYETPATWALKRDAETSDGAAQGSAQLEGAEFEVRYFDGYYDLSSLPDTATRTWIVKTDADGVARVSDELKVSGDEFYRDDSGAIAVPLGTVAVREVKAPSGYRLSDGSTYISVIRPTGSQQKSVTPFRAATVRDYVQRGGVAVGKIDRQLASALPQGAATLEGATFEIVSDNDRTVIVDGTAYSKGNVVTTIATQFDGSAYVARTSADCLPVGRYTLHETASSQGYLFDYSSRSWRSSFEVTQDGQVVDLTSAEDSVSNLVIRGDFEFSKVDGQTMQRLAGVPFMLTSNTTGEWHIVVTDENGMLSTAASWNPHTANSNANDRAISYQVVNTQPVDDGSVSGSSEGDDSQPADDPDAENQPEDAPAQSGDAAVDDGSETDSPATNSETAETHSTAPASQPVMVVDESLLDSSAGVWFNGSASSTCQPDDDMGALPYDTYTVTELPVAANEGHELVSFEVTVTRNARELDIGTLDDNPTPQEPEEPEPEPEPKPEPSIGTTLADAETGDHVVEFSDTVTLVDTVSYTGLEAGRAYLAEGTLHARGSDGTDAGELTDVAGEPIKAHATFVPETTDGTVEVTFVFSLAEAPEYATVAFEKVSLEGETVAVHEDIGDKGQTVEFVKPEEPIQPVPSEPQPTQTQPEQPVTATNVPEIQPTAKTELAKAIEMPKLGDPILLGVLAAMSIALVAAAIGAVSLGRMRASSSTLDIPRGAHAPLSSDRTPTCAPQVRARRRTVNKRAHARRK